MFRILITCFVLAAMAPFSHAQEKKQPNVLFIAIDDLNDWVGVLGKHPQAKTPNLDRLAKRSELFTRAYCPAPACNPSRTSLLTGLRPSSTGVYHNDQPWRPALPDAVTLPEFLKTHGYLVWGGGKIFHGGFPDDRGWHEYFHEKGKLPIKKLPPMGPGGNMVWSPLASGDDALADFHTTDWAIEKLKQKHAKPFFMAVGYTKPHLPWHAPQTYFDQHPLDKIELPKVDANDLDDVPQAGKKMARPQGDHKAITDAGQWKSAVQAYLACCTYMDGQLGRLLDALEKSPHASDTIIILWSDHGWSHGQKQHWRKFSLWEQDCRVVFMVNVPEGPFKTKAGECHRTVNLLDIYPTMIDLCNLPAKKGLEGTSLAPLLRDSGSAWTVPSITTHGLKNHSIRNERYRYIRYEDGSEELYDHDADPLEWRNLAKEPSLSRVREELARQLPMVDAPNAKKMK